MSNKKFVLGNSTFFVLYAENVYCVAWLILSASWLSCFCRSWAACLLLLFMSNTWLAAWLLAWSAVLDALSQAARAASIRARGRSLWFIMVSLWVVGKWGQPENGLVLCGWLGV